jgi:hypothetical protein
MMQRVSVIVTAALLGLFLPQFQSGLIACTAVNWTTWDVGSCCVTTYHPAVHYTYPDLCTDYFDDQIGQGQCTGGFTNCAGSYVQQGYVCPAQTLLKQVDGPFPLCQYE